MNSKKNKRVKIVQAAHIPDPQKKMKPDPKYAEKDEAKSFIYGIDSVADGKQMLEWILSPLNVDDFMKVHWEKSPRLIKRPNNRDYFSSLLTLEQIQRMIKDYYLEYSKNIDVTTYSKEKNLKQTLNPTGKVGLELWGHYSDGCSIRILNPQTFVPAIYKMNANLQEYFHTMCGTNVYLTPPNSQGFSPHFDDIEAFVLQLEGKKNWKVYSPRTPDEFLPRLSSENFNQDEIGTPILEVVLEPGDVLYFPRGFIHQASTVEGVHSLHITMSVYQKNSYADLLEILVPAALQNAIKTDVRFREGLPLNVYQKIGLVHSGNDTDAFRKDFRARMKKFFDKLIDNASIDDAMDQLAKKYQEDALPPYLSKKDKPKSVYAEEVRFENGVVENTFEIKLETSVKLLKANILRLVEEEEGLRVYFHSENSKEYHQYDATFIEVDENDIEIISCLVQTYPEFVKVENLPGEDNDRKILVITDLWEKGMLMTNKNVA